MGNPGVCLCCWFDRCADGVSDDADLPGLGQYGTVFGDDPDRSAGFAFGAQIFLGADHRQQLIFEFGARRSTDSDVLDGVVGIAARYQIALGQHLVILGEAFAASQEIGRASCRAKL